MQKPEDKSETQELPASGGKIDTASPEIDRDTLSIFQNRAREPGDPVQVSRAFPAASPISTPPTVAEQPERPLTREGIYASTKGARLVNDGIGYGEFTTERFRYVSKDGSLIEMTRRSVRTRTGRQTISEKKGGT